MALSLSFSFNSNIYLDTAEYNESLRRFVVYVISTISSSFFFYSVTRPFLNITISFHFIFFQIKVIVKCEKSCFFLNNDGSILLKIIGLITFLQFTTIIIYEQNWVKSSCYLMSILTCYASLHFFLISVFAMIAKFYLVM